MTKKRENKTWIQMQFTILFILICMISCSTYIPLTKNLIVQKNLNSDDLKSLQYYSYSYDIKYKGAEVKKTTEGIKSGDLFTGEQIERNYLIVSTRTAGAAREVDVDEKGIPRTLNILYDEDLPTLSYKLLWSEIENPHAAYILTDKELVMGNCVYKNINGLNSKIYINSDQLKKLIENKKIAKGVKVYDTKLKEKKEILND